jgi:tetratricopeptide (TPR) repeat protein
LYQKKGRYQEAADVLEKLIKLRPMKLAQKKLLEVLSILEVLNNPCSEPEGLNTDASKEFYSTARRYIELGDFTKAEQAFHHAIHAALDEEKASSTLLQSLFHEAKAAFYNESYERAIILLEIIITIDSNIGNVWSFLSSACRRADKDEEALNAAKHLIALTPENAEAWYKLGKRYAKLGQANSAAQAFNRALELNKKFKAAYRELNKISMEQ